MNAQAILLRAGANVHLTANGTLEALNTITIFGDYLNGPAGMTNILLEGTLQGRAPPEAPTINVYGNSGPDVITLRPVFVYGQVYIWGRDGADLITVDHMPSLDLTRKFIGGSDTSPASLVTTGFDSSLNVIRFTVNVDGQGGGDSYVVNMTGDSDYIVNVHDSGQPADGVDTLTINGMPSTSNVFLLRANFVALMQPIGDPSAGNYGADYERVNYDTSINELLVNGGTANDFFYVDDNSAITVLDGGPGDDFFQFGQMFGTDRTQPNVAPGDQIATVLTTVGYLSRGISYATTAYGGDGNDTFSVYSNKADLKLFGEDGNDTFIVRAFLIVGTSTVATNNTLVNGGSGDDNIQYNINAPVAIDGGNGFDTVVVIGTEANDNFVITKDGVMGAGLNVHYQNVEKVEVDGLGGNDNFYVLSTDPNVITVLDGGQGSDTFNVAGDVTGQVVAYNGDGTSAFINHDVSSTDPAYNGIFAPGVPVSVAGANAGQVVIQQNAGGTTVVQDGPGSTSQSSYTMSLGVAPPTSSTIWYITVAAAPDSYNDRTAGGTSIQISTDGVNWSSSTVLTFDGSNAASWNRMQTIYVRATSTSVISGDATIEVMHSVQSTTPVASTITGFNDIAISDVDVHVVDGDLPGLITTTPPSGLHIIEGSSTAYNQYTVQLTEAPISGETVNVALSSDDPRVIFSSSLLSFTSSNWMNAQTVALSANLDGIIEGPRLSTIFSTVTSSMATGGAYSNGVVDNPNVKVDVLDGDSGGVLVAEPTGNVIVSNSQPGSYTIQLTKAPVTGTTVTLRILDDGKTIVSSADGRFNAGVPDSPTVTFDPTNWNTAISLAINPNPSYVPTGNPGQPVQVFPAQPHTTAGIYGPVFIEGNSTAPRALVQGVRLPSETDVPLAIAFPPPPGASDATKLDTLNVFDDGNVSGDTGHMGAISATEYANLTSFYAPSFQSGLAQAQFGEIDGLEMSGPLTFSEGLPQPLTFAGGITYRNVDVVNVMLGNGNDTFTVDNTTPGSITVVQGGGGNDHLIANGGGGPGSPLILLGDTTQDGHFYDSTTSNINGHARGEHFTSGKDTIDASNDPNSVAIDGGPGNDTIYGSQAGDWLFGGSGNDEIHGDGGNDQISGDDGYNLDLSKRLDLSTQILLPVNSPSSTYYSASSDNLAAGNDTIYGDAGNDIVFGDHGVITQTPGTNRILTTGSVLGINTVLDNQGGNDTIYGNDGADVLLGGTGNDMIDGGAGNDLILGDNATMTRPSLTASSASPLFEALSGTTIYDPTTGNAQVNGVPQVDPQGSNWWSNFQVTLKDIGSAAAVGTYGDDYLAGGGGNDWIFGENGNDVIQGDGSIDIAPTTTLPCGNTDSVGANNTPFSQLVGACPRFLQRTVGQPVGRQPRH